MQLTVVLGATVTVTITGRSAVDGAPLPKGSKVALVSNDPTVATVPAIPDLTADTPSVSVPATVLASGSTDFTGTITAPDGTVFTAASTLIVTPVVPGLTHVTVDLTSP